MAWENEMTIIVRHIIDDLDSTNYQFSNDRIEEAITVAAQLIHNEMEFSIDYNIEVDNRTITPDPTTTPVGSNPKDDDFIALCCLRTAILFTSSQLKTYSLKAIAIRDGASSLDMRGVIVGLKVMYKTGKYGFGKSILGPYSPGSDTANRGYIDYRAGFFA